MSIFGSIMGAIFGHGRGVRLIELALRGCLLILGHLVNLGSSLLSLFQRRVTRVEMLLHSRKLEFGFFVLFCRFGRLLALLVLQLLEIEILLGILAGHQLHDLRKSRLPLHLDINRVGAAC